MASSPILDYEFQTITFGREWESWPCPQHGSTAEDDEQRTIIPIILFALEKSRLVMWTDWMLAVSFSLELSSDHKDYASQRIIPNQKLSRRPSSFGLANSSMIATTKTRKAQRSCRALVGKKHLHSSGSRCSWLNTGTRLGLV